MLKLTLNNNPPHIHIPPLFLLLLSLLTFFPTLIYANVEKVIFTVPGGIDVDVGVDSGGGGEGKGGYSQIITNSNDEYVSERRAGEGGYGALLSHASPRVLVHTLNLTSSTFSSISSSSPSSHIIPDPPNQNYPHKQHYTTTLPLINLHQGKRYEIRIVWAATSPIEDVEFEISFPLVPRGKLGEGQEEKSGKGVGDVNGHLDVKITREIWSREDVDEGVLMEFVLDPYILNILPESLIYIVSMVILVAGIAWFGVSSFVYKVLAEYGEEEEGGVDGGEKKRV